MSTRGGHTLKEEMVMFLLDSCIFTRIYGHHMLVKRCCANPNIVDSYAISIVTEDVVVGHVPRRIFTVCYLFIRHSGQIVCQVTGAGWYSIDLPPGGLKVRTMLSDVYWS